MRYIWLLFLLLLLHPAPGWAAIAFDAVSTSSSGTSAGTSHSHTFSGSDSVAIVCRAIRDIAGAVAIDSSAPTINGVAMTHLGGLTQSGNVVRVDLYYMLNPPTGAQTIATTPAASTDRHVTAVASYTGVAQSGTFNTSKTTAAGLSSANVDIDALDSAVNELGVMCVSFRGNVSLSPDATATVSTERADVFENADGNSVTLGFYEEAGAVTSIDMRVDSTVSSQAAAIAVSIRQASASTQRHIGTVILP